MSSVSEVTWSEIAVQVLGRENELGDASGVAWAEMFLTRLREANAPVVLMRGSLLGVIRDGHFIPWDDDLDFASTREWLLSENFEAFRRKCLSEGFIVRLRGAPLFPSASFYRDGFKASLAGYLRIGRFNYRRYYRLPSRFFGKADFRSPRWIEVNGVEWPVPIRSEEILSWVYGRWKTPVRSENEMDFVATKFFNPAWVRKVLFLAAKFLCKS